MAVLKLESSNTFCESYKFFNTHCHAKNLSPYTILDYDRIQAHLVNFMGCDFGLSDFTENKLNEYIAFCKAIGNNEITINTKLRHIRAIYNFFAERGYCRPIKIKLLKTTKTIKDTYTDAELRILLKRPNIKDVSFDDYRNWVIVNYLIATGNRLSSLVNIRICDLNLTEGEVILGVINLNGLKNQDSDNFREEDKYHD